MSKDIFTDGSIGKLNDCLSWINTYKNNMRSALKARETTIFDEELGKMEKTMERIKKARK